MQNMDKKELILEQAEKLFAEKGYYGLGLSELLKRCEIPKGSFYYYFPDGKIQLIQEVLEYSYHRMRGGISTWMTEEASAEAAFGRMIDHLSEGIRQGRFLSSMMLSMIAIESVYLDEQVNKTCRHIYCDWREFYAECLRHFGYEKTESKRVAQALFALVHGSLISSWIKQNDEDLQLVKEPLKEILKR
jgi:TetR/AcrR family transcriptional repressor of lmrAB and yxaGH operons